MHFYLFFSVFAFWHKGNFCNKIAEKDPNGNITRYTYDKNSNCTSKTDALGTTAYMEYDKKNRLVKAYMIKDGQEYAVSYTYLKQFVGEIISITETADVVYLGKDFPDEFAGSKYTRNAKGARTKAKANAAQGIREMVEIATDKVFRENHKTKHKIDAANGWYYFTTRFALPVYSNEDRLDEYNVYSGCLVVNCNSKGKMFLYDLVDIKKEASNPLKTNK